jgi:hypothetical protein
MIFLCWGTIFKSQAQLDPGTGLKNRTPDGRRAGAKSRAHNQKNYDYLKKKHDFFVGSDMLRWFLYKGNHPPTTCFGRAARAGHFFYTLTLQSSKVARLAVKHQTLNTQNITASSGRQTSNTQNITASYQLHIYLLTTFTV